MEIIQKYTEIYLPNELWYKINNHYKDLKYASYKHKNLIELSNSVFKYEFAGDFFLRPGFKYSQDYGEDFRIYSRLAFNKLLRCFGYCEFCEKDFVIWIRSSHLCQKKCIECLKK